MRCGAGAQCCADLIGEGDGHDPRLKRHLEARCWGEDEAPQGLAAVLNQEFDLGPGKAHALHAPDPASEQHVPVVLEAHDGAVTPAVLVATSSQVEQARPARRSPAHARWLAGAPDATSSDTS